MWHIWFLSLFIDFRIALQLKLQNAWRLSELPCIAYFVLPNNLYRLIRLCSEKFVRT